MSIIKLYQEENLFSDSEVKTLIDRGELTSLLYSYLRDISLTDFIGLLTNKYKESLEYVDLCNGKKAGQKISLLFNPHRLEIAGHKEPSIYSSLKKESFVNGLARATLFQKGRVSELLYASIRIGINGTKYADEFPPHIARDIYKKYGMNKNSKILDPCSGWGGRMIGASCVSNYYFGHEPSLLTYSGLLRIGEFISSYRSGFNYVIMPIPYEDAEIEHNKYDIALTSPPYYDTELYTTEETNSCNRYKSFNEWTNAFYVPMIEKTMNGLKDNAFFILNIGSRQYPLNDILLDNFSLLYKIKKSSKYLVTTGGIRGDASAKEGETFYEIQKAKP